jgi:hypothetical protein
MLGANISGSIPFHWRHHVLLDKLKKIIISFSLIKPFSPYVRRKYQSQNSVSLKVAYSTRQDKKDHYKLFSIKAVFT